MFDIARNAGNRRARWDFAGIISGDVGEARLAQLVSAAAQRARWAVAKTAL